MTRLRLVLASFVFAAGATACAPGLQQKPTTPVTGQTQLDRAAVRAKLAARRDEVMKRFLAYREARVYPINTLPGGGFRHVWLDDSGNLCAAATLVSDDWGRDAAIRAGAANVEIKIADVKTGPLADWVLTTGLTHAELVAIQVPGFNERWNERQGEAARQLEVNRLYGIYIDVERQMRSLWDENLDLATDALMRHPELARDVLADRTASPGIYGKAPVG
jgi:hypothetical protein